MKLDRHQRIAVSVIFVLLLLYFACTARPVFAQTLTATPSSCTTGSTCRPTLTWGAWPCAPTATATPTGGGWTGAKAVSGSLQVTAITATRTYTLTCQSVPAGGSATLNWTPPAKNTDGSNLSDLAGYKVYWGTTQGSYPNSTQINNPAATSYVVGQLTTATWYFAVSALNTPGAESMLSNSAMKPVDAGAPTTFTRSVTVTVSGTAAPATPADLQTAGTFTTTLSTRLYAIGAQVPMTTPAVSGATRYEWEVTHYENKTVDALTSTTPTVTWSPTKAGHYTPRVRACNATGCSAWFASSDASYWLHAWIAAPQF